MKGNQQNNLDEFAESLFLDRSIAPPVFPRRERIHAFINTLLQVFFPHFSAETFNSSREISARVKVLLQELEELLLPICGRAPLDNRVIASSFAEKLQPIYQALKLDAQALFEGDPAAESVDEVILAYPGFFAIAVYRIAHEFYKLKVPIFPRIATEYAHQITGIDIHPGATIGESFFIDHGTGVVIGETCTIGNKVKVYQGVTLGALSVEKSLSSKKRHPTIEDNVVIYSNATILGGETVVGHGSIIGGNVWLTESVPPLSTVYHKSEIKVRSTS